MDCPPFQQDGGQNTIGSYIAVGTFNPAIEIWNLDVLDPLEPTAILGGVEMNSKKKKGKKGIDSNLKVGSHEGAVMGLSANKVYRQFLASGSADNSVKIWDVTQQTCQHTFFHHKDKVQSVQWHPIESWLLASGSFDKTIALLDCRSGSQSASYKISADIECMTWDPFSPFHLYCSLENGIVTCFDCRNTKNALFTFQAHDETASSISFSSSVPGMFATASVDKSVKIWDALGSSQNGSLPQLVAYKTLNVGKLFTMSYYTSNPFTLAAGGDEGMIFVWESDEQEAIARHFNGRVNNSTSSNGLEIERDDSWMDEVTETETNNKPKKKKKDKKKK
jgi:periodic tryptophan protein 1